jgi:arginyl-tRNA synthetase
MADNSRPLRDGSDDLTLSPRERAPARRRNVVQKSAPFPEESDLAPRPVDLSKPFVVRSLNCTSNKPLHLGHLRNVVLGAAMSDSLEALGARVLRHCVLEDTGRFMTEAMAAVRDFESSGGPPENLRLKPDHFIGSCYRRYRQKLTATAANNNDGPDGDGSTAATGYEARGDEADDLMRALMRGEEAALRLRARVRGMALAGQQATLQRIGVTFDRCDYESAEDPFLDDFIAACSGRGLLQRNEDGELSYPTSKGRRLRLINGIGLAEESARLVCFNKRLADAGMIDQMIVIMAGSEWKMSMSSYAELLSRLGVENISEHYAPTFYGMVMLNGKKMASSTGTGLLVDDLVDEMVGGEQLGEWSRQCGVGGRADEFAVTIAKCFLLSFARVQKIDFTFERLSSPEANPGWAIAGAWVAVARDGSPRATAPSSPETRRILLDSLARVSFEDAVEHTKEIAERILDHKADDADKSDFVAMVTALSIVPRRSEFLFSSAPSLGSH